MRVQLMIALNVPWSLHFPHDKFSNLFLYLAKSLSHSVCFLKNLDILLWCKLLYCGQILKGSHLQENYHVPCHLNFYQASHHLFMNNIAGALKTCVYLIQDVSLC